MGDYIQKIGENSLDFHVEDSPWKNIEEIAQEHSFFHWDLEFLDIFYDQNGERKKNPGFDVIIGNPPWDILKRNLDEFFSPFYKVEHDTEKFSRLTKNKKNLFIKNLLSDEFIYKKWIIYQNNFKKQLNYFNKSQKYKYQISQINGKNTASDNNLYKLFVERSHNLLKYNGYCGLITPAGIHSDLGTKKLRNLLLEKNRLIQLLSFINKNGIFKHIHKQFKFCIFIFQSGGTTKRFLACFKIQSIDQLQNPKQVLYEYDVNFIKTYSPSALSIIESENKTVMKILEKLFTYPLLSSKEWDFNATSEFHMTGDSKLFKTTNVGYPLYEGKMINQFNHKFTNPRYWIPEKQGNKILEKKELKRMKKINANHNCAPQIHSTEYRLVWRDITNSIDKRTLYSTILPPFVFLGNTLNYLNPIKFDGEKYIKSISHEETFFICGLLNSFPIDFILRHKIFLHISIFYLKELPIPHYNKNNPLHKKLYENTVKLICTTEEYLNIKKNLTISDNVIEPEKRLLIESQINALSAKIYNLSNKELETILDNFTIVDPRLKEYTLLEFNSLSITYDR